MKKTLRFCLVSAFILVLTTATFAGEIQTGKAPPPPPDQQSATTPGEIDTGREIPNPQEASDSVTDIALELLQTMLSVF
ncbi:MAG TPA: hypothetical protein VN643_03420 [Pyrinomonadaceae bacterium]|nr:hypothetical protein [Pyrinomonadaceae bacterium]